MAGGPLMLLAIVAFIGVATSTKEGRAEAKAKLAPWERWIAIAAAILWALLILGWIFPPSTAPP